MIDSWMPRKVEPGQEAMYWMSSDFITSTMKSDPVLPMVCGGMSSVGRSVMGTPGTLLRGASGIGCATALVADTAAVAAGAAARPARNWRRLIVLLMKSLPGERHRTRDRGRNSTAEFATRGT